MFIANSSLGGGIVHQCHQEFMALLSNLAAYLPCSVSIRSANHDPVLQYPSTGSLRCSSMWVKFTRPAIQVSHCPPPPPHLPWTSLPAFLQSQDAVQSMASSTLEFELLRIQDTQERPPYRTPNTSNTYMCGNRLAALNPTCDEILSHHVQPLLGCPFP